MRRKICISKGAFWNPYLNEDVNKFVTKIVPKLDIDGVEFLLGEETEFHRFKFTKASLNILKDYDFNTIHVPFRGKRLPLIFCKNKRTKKMLNSIHNMYDMINAKSINIHPQQIQNFNVFDTENYNYTIENMEIHHQFSLNDYANMLKDNPKFGFVLDTTHATEANELNQLVKRFRKDISYAHLSATYFNHLHLPLHALRPEYLKPLNIIKKEKFPLILECQIGTRDVKEYKKEVDFVRRWINQKS